MSTELICPDCGGVIGGDPADSARACKCWANKSPNGDLPGPDSSGDTVIERQEAPRPKVCCQCGIDLTGKKRLRDSRGYWCYACHTLDKEANKPKGERCADCGRIVAEAALSEFEGRRICGPCRAERKELAKERRRLSPVKTDAHDRLAKQRLYWLLAILALLIVIIILQRLKIIGV
jgi:hypothetical protein